MAAIALVVELEIDAARLDAFLTRARQHRDNVLRHEAGCLRFDIVTADGAPGRVFLYEVYADEAAVETHMGTPYMAEYLKDTGPMVLSRKRNRCSLAHDSGPRSGG